MRVVQLLEKARDRIRFLERGLHGAVQTTPVSKALKQAIAELNTVPHLMTPVVVGPYKRTAMNRRREGWARQTLEFFGTLVGQVLKNDETEMVTDLLCDLMHYCAQNKIDFDARLYSAYNTHFMVESKGDE